MEKRFIILITCCFLIDIHDGYLSLQDADNEQNNFATELKNFVKGTKAIEKKYFLNELDYILVQGKKFLLTLYADYFHKRT